MTEPSRSRKRSKRQPPECGEFLDAVEGVIPERVGEGIWGCETAWDGERLFAAYEWTCDEGRRTASLRMQWFPGEAKIWLGSLEVAPENTGAGNGTALVNALERAASVIGVQAIRLFSRRTTAEFWQRLGYEPEADPRYLSKTINEPSPT